MTKLKRKKIVKIVLHVFGVLLFVFATSYALLGAYGYQVDLLHRNLVKTSIIDLGGRYQDVSIVSNGKKVGNKLPYQIKNVESGKYTIDIKSENFHNWQKTVEVIEDIVTRINDIYLVPTNLDDFSSIKEIDFLYDDTIFNGSKLFFVDKEDDLLHKLNLDGGSIDNFETVVLLPNLSYKKVYAVGTKYLAFDDDHIVNLLDLSSDKFIKILVPDEFTDFNIVASSTLHGIYKNNGSLFFVNIGDNGVFNEIILLKELAKTNKLSVYCDGDLIFVKLDDDLYMYRSGVFSLIDVNVVSAPQVSPLGDKILYLSASGEIYTYSFNTLKHKLIARFAKKINSLEWFFDNNHISILKGGDLIICDMAIDNCPTLMDGIVNKNIYISNEKPVIGLITKEGIKEIDLTVD